MSAVSEGKVIRLLNQLNLIVINEPVPAGLGVTDVVGYDWKGRNEDDDAAFSGAYVYLKTMLTTAGVRFEYTQYQLVDVHSLKSLLNFEDEKVSAKLRGGTDIIITPYSVAKFSYTKELCVLFEIRASYGVEKETGFIPSEPRAILELLSARFMSNQPNVLVIMTDLIKSAVAFKFHFVDRRFTIRRSELSLSQVGQFVFSFLQTHCVPIGDFVPTKDSDDPRHLEPIEFKRQKLSAPSLPLEWQHYVEIMEDPDSTETERELISRQLFLYFETLKEDKSWMSNYI